jgi:hypothetical protein
MQAGHTSSRLKRGPGHGSAPDERLSDSRSVSSDVVSCVEKRSHIANGRDQRAPPIGRAGTNKLIIDRRPLLYVHRRAPGTAPRGTSGRPGIRVMGLLVTCGNATLLLENVQAFRYVGTRENGLLTWRGH